MRWQSVKANADFGAQDPGRSCDVCNPANYNLISGQSDVRWTSSSCYDLGNAELIYGLV
jgi:hypothetical protein